MADRQVLEVQPRTIIGKQVAQLRRQGLLPATVYGKGVQQISVQVSEREFNLLYRRTGRTTLMDLRIDGRDAGSVFVQEVQRHPLTRAIIHADLRVVDMRSEMDVAVPVMVTGESPLAHRGDAVVNHIMSSIDVRALPDAIPQHVEVDISGLTSVDQSIYVRDVPLPAGVTLLSDPGAVVIALTPTRAGIEDAASQAASAEPELIREKRESDEA